MDLYKTYILTEYLFKLLPTNGHEHVDLTQKLALEHNKLSEGFSGSIILKPTEKVKTLKGEKGGTGKKLDEKRDHLRQDEERGQGNEEAGEEFGREHVHQQHLP